MSLVGSKNGCQDFHQGYHHSDAYYLSVSLGYVHNGGCRTQQCRPTSESLVFPMVACNIFVNVLYSCIVRFYIHAISLSCYQRKTVSYEEILSKWKLVGVPEQNLPRLTTQVVKSATKVDLCHSIEWRK